MALEFAFGAVQWLSSDTNGTNYTISGLSFQPKAIRFYWMGAQSASDLVSESVSERRGMGFAASTSSRRCVSTFSSDGAATSDCGSMLRDDCVASAVDGNGNVAGQLDISAINSDGFTLTVDNQISAASITVFWEAWGGADITNVTVGECPEPSTVTDTTHTATGFTNTEDGTMAVFFAGIQSTAAANTGAATDSGLCVGFAANETDQVVEGNNDDASTAMDTDGIGVNAYCIAQVVVGGGARNASANMSDVGTDQFTLTWDARALTNRRNIYMAIKGGKWKTGNLSINGNTSNATATTSPAFGFVPKGICLIGRMAAASTTAAANDRIGIGTATGTSSRQCMGILDEDATASSNCEINHTIQYDQCLAYPSTAGALQTAYDINAWNSNSVQLIVDVNGGVSGEYIGYIGFGDEKITKSGSDNVDVSITDDGVVINKESDSDSLDITITDTASIFSPVSVSDSLDVSITDVGSVIQRFYLHRSMFDGTAGTDLPVYTPDDGTDWETLSGTFALDGSGNAVLESDNGGDHQNGVVTDLGVADVWWDVGISLPSAFDAGIIFNVQDNNNYWLFWINSTGSYILYKREGGSFTQEQTAGSSPATNSVIHYRIATEGDNIKIYDKANMGSPIFNYTPGSRPFKTATKFGLRQYDSATYVSFQYAQGQVLPAVGVSHAVLSDPTHVRIVSTPPTFGGGPYDFQLQIAPDSTGSPGTWADVGSPENDVFIPTEVEVVLDEADDWYRFKITDAGSVVDFTPGVQMHAAYEAVQDGNWDDTDTWSGHAGPAGTQGCRVVINDFVVTMVTGTGTVTIGDSPEAGENVLDIGPGGRLDIKPNVTLCCRGNVIVDGTITTFTGDDAILCIDHGGKFQMDGSHVSSPPMKMKFTLGGDRGFAQLLTTGTKVDPATFETHPDSAGSGNAYFFASAGIFGPWASLNWTKFNDFGTEGEAGEPCINIAKMTTAPVMIGCTFYRCGAVALDIRNLGCTITDNWWDHLCGDIRIQSIGGSEAPGSARTMLRNTFSSFINLSVKDTQCEDNFFLKGWGDASNAAAWNGWFTNNIVRHPSGGPEYYGDWDNNWLYNDASDLVLTGGSAGTYSAENQTINPHWGGAALGAWEVKNNVLESLWTDGVGDLNYGTAEELNFHHNLILPEFTSDDNSTPAIGPGTLCTLNADAGAIFNHNTQYCGGQGGLALAEGGSGAAGMCDSLQSNIFWSHSSYTSSGFTRKAYCPVRSPYDPGGPNGPMADDAITTADYNCGYNLYSGSSYEANGYDIPLTYTPGTHDVDENPSFVAPYRVFWKWVQSIEGSTLPGNATPSRFDYSAYGLWKLSLQHRDDLTGYDADYTLADYFTWVREGYNVQNPDLEDAGHDATTIGALPFIAGIEPIEDSDTLSLSITDDAAALVKISASDNLDVSITDAASVLTFILQSDNLDLSITDSASALGMLSVSDNLDLSITDDATTIVRLEGLDDLNVAIDDSYSLSAGGNFFKSASDSLDVSITETTSLSIQLSAADDVSLSITDTASIFSPVLVTDNLGLSIDEATAITSQVSVADTLSIAVVESTSLFAQIPAFDTLSVAIDETAALAVSLSASDSLGLSIDDTAGLDISFSQLVAIDAILGVSDEPILAITSIDILGISESSPQGVYP